MKRRDGKLRVQPFKWARLMVKSAHVCHRLPSVAWLSPTLINLEKEIAGPRGRLAGKQ